MEKEIEVAALYQKIYENEQVELFVPYRIIIGKTDENGLKFYDALSNTVYFSLDNYSDEGNYFGFHKQKTFQEIKNMYPDMEILDAIYAYFKKLKEDAYYYALETGGAADFCLKSMPVDDFYKKFNCKLNYNCLPGKLEDIDFQKIEEVLQKSASEDVISTSESMSDQLEKETDETLEMMELPSITEVYDEITKHILCQDIQVKKILTAIYRSIVFDEQKLKANIFLYGPSGVGKTAIIEQVGKKLGLPVTIEDANAFTISGYEGKNCEDALKHLYERANGDLELAQQGILVFDEIDKKRKNGSSGSGIASDGVQHSLLKIIEGGVVEVTLNRHTDETIKFDTSQLKVIVSGAFEDLYKEMKRTRPVGFQTEDAFAEKNSSEITERFLEYGMSREFLGRFNSFVELNSLSKEDLKKILLESESSVFKTYQRSLSKEGFEVFLQPELCDKICELAYKRRLGARSLNTIVNELFDEFMFKFLSEGNQEKEIHLGMDLFTKVEEEKKKVLKRTVQ